MNRRTHEEHMIPTMHLQENRTRHSCIRVPKGKNGPHYDFARHCRRSDVIAVSMSVTMADYQSFIVHDIYFVILATAMLKLFGLPSQGLNRAELNNLRN